MIAPDIQGKRWLLGDFILFAKTTAKTLFSNMEEKYAVVDTSTLDNDTAIVGHLTIAQEF